MKKITLLMLALFVSVIAFAQCPAGTGGQYPGTTQTVINDGVSHNISTCNYSSEYSIVEGFTVGEDYEISITEGGVNKYATLVDGADGTTVITHGASPLMWTATVANLQINWSDDAACGSTENCHVTSYINLTQAPTCPDPTAANATNVTPASADLGWTQSGGNTNWDIEWGVDGFTPTGTPTVNDTADNPYMLMGLTDATAYDYYVRADCGMDDTTDVSAWVGPISFTTAALPPANDECTGAIALACGDTGITGDTSVGATDTGGNAAADVWYSFTVAGAVDQDVTISLCNSSYDTVLRVYDDCPATNQILFNDDNATACGALGGNTRSEGTFTAVVGATYYVMVEGYNTSTGAFSLDVTCVDNAIPAPANDLCADAVGLTLGASISGTTAGATDSSTGPTDDTTCEGFTFKSDVWYSFTTTGTNDVTIATTLTGASTAASIAVYPNCGQLDTESVGCSATSPLAITALAAGTYYVRVWSDGATARTEGTFDIVADATLSTQDINANGLAFTYFPNPVSSDLTLKAQKDIENVSVYNMLGQEVLRTAPNAVNTVVNMSDLQSGAYFVKVTIGNTTETVRVLKN